MTDARRHRAIIVSPGPVEVPRELMRGLPQLHHRTKAFREISTETVELLKVLLRTSSPVYLLTSSGTGAMEAAVVNVTVPGSSVLVVSGGKFGRRWAEICDAYECRTDLVEFGCGSAIDVDSIVQRIDRDRPQFVAVTHVESSTGLLFPLREFTGRLGAHRPVVIVDAISSLGAEDFDMDGWGIDVAVGASQKSLAAPAGTSFIAMGKNAVDVAGGRRRGMYYLDLKHFEVEEAAGYTPFTPAVQTVQIMHRSLLTMKALGFDEMVSRQRRASAAFLAAARHLSLASYSESPSSAVQVLAPQPAVGVDEILARLEREGFIAAGGQGELKGRVMRTGFLGLFGIRTLERLVSATAEALRASGCRVDVSSALECLRKYDVVSSPFEAVVGRILED
ncbi:MAG: aminotransferase class V-fold PLP-dependent enzyme [Candidatus Krumholzibacteria bacterium]|nr:aminotransferase class V-fold PLP-dependent enzyme [Candidatus Krumholzibacteria bacterium]